MKILYVADESIIGGVVRSGVAEVVDSLANAVSEDCAVSVICPDRDSIFLRMAFGLEQREGFRTCRLLGVTYYLLPRGGDFLGRAAALADTLAPDVLHNFAAPELLGLLSNRPGRAVYTIDQADFVRGRETALEGYDAVTTVSRAYAAELLAGGDALAELLGCKDFCGITNGILTSVFNPANGLFLEASYRPEDQAGKTACKRRLLATYGIPGDLCVYLFMGRLVRDKGLDGILEAVHAIRDSGGFLVVVGRGEQGYEDRLSALTRGDGALWVDRWASPMQLMPMLSGTDFYLSPSITEPCGLMPMTAARYGAVPIVTLNGGLGDNMDEEIAVIVGEDGMAEAIARAAALYDDKDALAAKRRTCMTRDFSWETRKAEYLELYRASERTGPGTMEEVRT